MLHDLPRRKVTRKVTEKWARKSEINKGWVVTKHVRAVKNEHGVKHQRGIKYRVKNVEAGLGKLD